MSKQVYFTDNEMNPLTESLLFSLVFQAYSLSLSNIKSPIYGFDGATERGRESESGEMSWNWIWKLWNIGMGEDDTIKDQIQFALWLP